MRGDSLSRTVEIVSKPKGEKNGGGWGGRGQYQVTLLDMQW